MAVSDQMKGMCWRVYDKYISVDQVDRNAKEQSSLDRESRRIQLYFYRNCCESVKVRRHCKHLGLRVVEKDIERVNLYRNELLKGGGAMKVPCLRVEGRKGTKWYYRQDEIEQYLDKRFSQ